MHINTQMTVRKTSNQYCWDDLENWWREDNIWVRSIYHDEALVIYQQIRFGNHQIFFRTSEYTMCVSSGEHKDVQSNERRKKVPFYELKVLTTNGKKNVYRSLIDEAGYQDIKGDRQHVLDFYDIIPRGYFSLEKDEKIPHISTYWMRSGAAAIIPHRQFSEKERT